MKKVTSYLMVAAIALGFAACSNEDVPNTTQKDGTFIQVSFSEAKTGTRASQADAVGTTQESKVVSAAFLAGATKVDFSAFTQSGNTWTANQAELYDGAFGVIRTALVVNPVGTPTLNATTTKAIGDLATLANATSGFTMTSVSTGTNTIEQGVEKAVAEAGTKNQFTFQVERVTSKVQVTQPDAGITVNVPGFSGATIESPRFAVAGSATSVYLFADKAGTRQLDNTTNKYTNLETAIHNNPLSTYTGGIYTPRTGVTKVSAANTLVGIGTGWDSNLQSADIIKDANYATTSYTNNGIYFLENSINHTITGKGQVKFSDITFVKVYAKFVPAAGQVLKLDGSDLVAATVEEVNAGTTEIVGGETITNSAGTFYKGADDGKLYLTLTASRAAGNSKSEKYSGGKMVWKTPANGQLSGDGTYFAYLDTRRNNIYSLQITQITGLGDNYDPNDTTDPNIPEPTDNPDEPDQDPDDPVDPAQTYVSVKATILDWNLVHRGVILE